MRFTDASFISVGVREVGAVDEAGLVADHLRVARAAPSSECMSSALAPR